MKLGHDFCFVFPVHDSHGAVAPDALPTALIYEDHGGAIAYAPTVAQIGALTGQYYCYGDATAAHGFDVGKDYNIMVTAVISGATQNSRIAQFTIEANDIDDVGSTAQSIYVDTQRVDSLLEDDGLGSDRFTAKALENAPSSGATAAEVWEYILAGAEPPGSAGAILADMLANLGAPIALDGGLASIAGMLIKMADNAGGSEFASSTDSLHELSREIDPAAIASAILIAQLGPYLVTSGETVAKALARSEASMEMACSKKPADILTLEIDMTNRMTAEGSPSSTKALAVIYDRDGHLCQEMIQSFKFVNRKATIRLRNGTSLASPYSLAVIVRNAAGRWSSATYLINVE